MDFLRRIFVMDRTCSFCNDAREHVEVNSKVICLHRENTRNGLQRLWREGFHGFAEDTAARLGLDLGLPAQPFLERLKEHDQVPRIGAGEIPTIVPPGGRHFASFIGPHRDFCNIPLCFVKLSVVIALIAVAGLVLNFLL